MFWTRYDVFLSYSRADSARVTPLRDELRRLGYRVFFDVGSITVGDHWRSRLANAVRSSRTLILCWSEHSRASDYVTFEYSRAESLQKPIYPWLLDSTPLPAMLEINGITTQDALQAVAELHPRLGWTLVRRRIVEAAVAVLLVAAAAVAVGFFRRPPPPIDIDELVMPSLTQLESTTQSDGGTQIFGGDEEVWTTAQAIRAETDFEPFASANAARIRHAFDFIEQNRQKAPQAGWGMIFGAPTITEIDAWVQLAYIQSLRIGVVWAPAQVPQIASRIDAGLKEICERQMPDGGWVPIDAKDQHFERTYSTIMAIWALVEAQQLPQLHDVATAYDQNLMLGVRWLLKTFDASDGWSADPIFRPGGQTKYALTAQAYYVLSRAAALPEFAWLNNTEPNYAAARHLLLADDRIVARDLNDNDQLDPQDTRFVNVRYTNDPNHTTYFQLESSQFLWAPWMLAAYTDIANDSSVLPAERRTARAKAAQVLQKIAQGRQQLGQGEVFILAETLIGVGEAAKEGTPRDDREGTSK